MDGCGGRLDGQVSAGVKLAELIATLSLPIASISIPNLRQGIVDYQSTVARRAAKGLTSGRRRFDKRHERLARVFPSCDEAVIQSRHTGDETNGRFR